MIFNHSFSVLANENVESSEPETTYTETIENNDTIESIEEIEGEEEIKEGFEEEFNEEAFDEAFEDIEEPEEVEEVEEVEEASPSEVYEEVEECLEEEIEENIASKSDVDEIIDGIEDSIDYFICEKIIDKIKITLTADPEVFPEDAIFCVEKIEDEAVEEVIEEALEKERDKNVNVATSYKFDIKMLVNGEEVQPNTNKGSVKVTFTLAEELSECLDVNAYHLKEKSDGELTAENLGAEVKTVEEVVEETVKENGNSSELVNTVGTDEDGVLLDGNVEDDVTRKVTKIEVETDGFSYYVVEFTYQFLSYTLIGSTTKLSNILSEFGITATPSEVTVSDETLFTVTKDANDEDWTVKVLQNFVSATMRVTIDSSQEYEISLSNALDSAPRQNITYIDETGVENNKSCIIITSADGYSFESGEWYAVIADVTINTRIENTAETGNPAHLIIVDGATLTAPKGIHNRDGNELVIYGQSAGTGTITIQNVDDHNAGIGSNKLFYGEEAGGILTINGGNISVTGSKSGAGIGGAAYGAGGEITINGGTVTATGGHDGGAGIGSGELRTGGFIIINGGTVTATGGHDGGAGIGAGLRGNGGSIFINGGTVTATGGFQGGAGIGGGEKYGGGGEGGDIIINGGNVTARGGLGASGIGHGRAASNGNVDIEGGTVNAYGGDSGGGVHWGKAIGDGEKTIKPELMIYAGDSKETAKFSNPDGVGARYAFISDACAKVAYTVSHQWQKTDATGYEEHETETLYGGVGWKTEAVARSYTGFSVQNFSQETIALDGSTVVAIRYNRNTYTITFDMNKRAIALNPINALYGAMINPPQDPVAEGYLFEGWYIERECINMYTFNTMPAENITLYAKWSVDPSKKQDIQYVDEDGSTKTASCIILSMNADYYVFDTGEWYAVTGNVTLNNRIENEALEDSSAHLILTDEALMTVKGGIHNPDGKELVIYGQSVENGVLTITDVPQGDSGIGGDFHENGGKVIINGGIVNASGGRYGAGIGGGQDGEGGKITINDGTVIVAGGYEGSGIGGGLSGNGGNITINGGKVTATGGEFGPGIGAGRHTTGATLVFGSNPRALKAGSSISDASNIDVDTYKNTYQDYRFVTMNYDAVLYTITWKDWDGNVLAVLIIDEGALPIYPGLSNPSRSGYIFTGWTPEIGLAAGDKTYTATYKKKSSGGGGGGGSAGMPRYDSEGNILGPSGKQNYIYDGTNPPNLAGNINVSSWNYATGTPQSNNIKYVQNTDSFVRADNTPVVTDWVGVTTNDIGKVMWYRTDAKGKILKNQFIQIGNNIYYLDNNGIMRIGQITINGKIFTFDATQGANEGRFLY